MEILFCGSFFPFDRETEIWENSKGPMVISANTFQNALIAGWRENNLKIKLLTAPAIGSYPKLYRNFFFKKSVFKLNGKENFCVGFLNVGGIKNVCIYHSLKSELRKWVKNTIGSKTILVYSMMPAYIKAAISIKREFPNVRVCVIVLDLPEFFDEDKGLLRKLYARIITKQSYSINNSIDSYVLLTRHMVDSLDMQARPWMLLEGIYLPGKRDGLRVEKTNKNAILYTGKFDARFGLQNLLDAFMNITDDNYELWLCGEGTFKETIIASTKIDNRIKYMGLLKREDVLVLQKKATILVNPRLPEGEYTKYSFPSKTMEYMASGTPTMMYNLPGIPEEYFPYLVIVENNSIENLKETIVTWCSKSREELSTFGGKAAEFILKNKNAQVQSKRVIEFLSKN